MDRRFRRHVKAKFVNEEVDIVLSTYADGKAVAINLVDINTGECIAHPTVFVPGLPEGFVAIKNYSENEGMLNALVVSGLVGEPLDTIPTGFVELEVCPLMV